MKAFEKKQKEHSRIHHLTVAFRHMRGAEKTINRIVNKLFPDVTTFAPAPMELFEKNPEKEKMLASLGAGIDYQAEKLLCLIEANGCNYVGSNSEGSDNSGND